MGRKKQRTGRGWLLVLFVLAMGLGACGAGETEAPQEGETTTGALGAATLEAGEPLRVVATTSILGNVVRQVGGERIALEVMMGAGQDPHTFQPSAGDLARVERAHLIFVNGFDFEEGLLDDLRGVAGDRIPIVSASAGIEPLSGETHEEEAHEEEGHEAEGHEHEEHEADPHVWFDVSNVQAWTETIEGALAALDPEGAATYAAGAEAYRARLADLEGEIRAGVAAIPPESRRLVTNHDTFQYFARAYGFEVIGTVLPGSSTGAEPSAADVAALAEAVAAAGVPVLFVEHTVSTRMAATVAEESGVRVVPLYTDALGEAGSEADSYINLMRANLTAIVGALAPAEPTQ